MAAGPDRTQPPSSSRGHLHRRWMWGDKKLGDDKAALRYRNVDNFPESDWRTHAKGNFPEPLDTPSHIQRVRGERSLKAR